MWFQAAECSQCELIINFDKQSTTFWIFLTENLPILNPYLPPNLKICDPILVTLLKTRPRYSHSSRENATPSSGRSPLAFCKGVPPHPPLAGVFRTRSWWQSVVKVARSGVCVTLSEISLSFVKGIQFFLQFVSYFRNNVRKLLSWNFLWGLHDIDDIKRGNKE